MSTHRDGVSEDRDEGVEGDRTVSFHSCFTTLLFLEIKFRFSNNILCFNMNCNGLLPGLSDSTSYNKIHY